MGKLIAIALLNLVIIGVIVFALWHLRLKGSPAAPEDRSQLKTAQATVAGGQKVSKVSSTQLAENGYFGAILSTTCPAGTGVRDIQCKAPPQPPRHLNSIANNFDGVNTHGAICVFDGPGGFRGTIEATCDPKLFNIPIYNINNFSPGENSLVPEIFELWKEESTVKANDGYVIELACPVNYSASNLMCNEYLPSLDAPSPLLSYLIAKTKDGNSAGRCVYGSVDSTQVTIRLNCSKNK